MGDFVPGKGSSLVEPFKGLKQRTHVVKFGLYKSPEMAAFWLQVANVKVV